MARQGRRTSPNSLRSPPAAGESSAVAPSTRAPRASAATRQASEPLRGLIFFSFQDPERRREGVAPAPRRGTSRSYAPLVRRASEPFRSNRDATPRKGPRAAPSRPSGVREAAAGVVQG